MGKHVPFTVNLSTILVFIPMGAISLLLWIKIFQWFFQWKFLNEYVLLTILTLYIVLTYKYFVKGTVHLIMLFGLALAVWFGVKNSDEINHRLTYDTFTWKPWMLWKLFFWRPKTVEEMAKEKIIKASWDQLETDRKNEELKKDQAFNDAVAKRVEELKNEKGVKTNG